MFAWLSANFVNIALVAVLAGGINFAVAVMAIIKGNMIEDGMLQTPFVNLICGLMFVVVGVEMLLKKRVDAAAEEE